VRIAFKAIECSFDSDDETLTAGLSTGDNWDDEDGHYLCFQKGADDREFHFEFDDQLFGDYGVVRECRLSRSLLSVDLKEPFQDLEEVDGFDVELAVDDESFGELRTGLGRIIEGTSTQLFIQ
jgi:hypothetical protein